MKSLEQVRNDLKKDMDLVQWKTLLGEENLALFLELARNHETPSFVLNFLSNSNRVSILHEIAKNKNSERELLLKLSQHRDMLVRDYAKRTLDQKVISEMTSDDQTFQQEENSQ
jgi:hypothetical protein